MLGALHSGVASLDTGVLLLRLVVGVFFTLSGWHKLFVPARHQSLVNTLAADHVPLIRINQWFVPAVEFGAGMALTIGLFAPFAALLLIGICTVACAVDGVPRITSRFAPIDKADWLDDLLYLPEVLYLVMLVVVVLAGPGQYSVDALMYSLH